MPAESMEMPQMNNNMVAQPQTTAEQPIADLGSNKKKSEEPMSMSLRGGGICEDCCCCCAGCCALEAICCCLGAEEVADHI